MKTWIVSSLDEETIQGEETIWGNTVCILLSIEIKKTNVNIFFSAVKNDANFEKNVAQWKAQHRPHGLLISNDYFFLTCRILLDLWENFIHDVISDVISFQYKCLFWTRFNEKMFLFFIKC